MSIYVVIESLNMQFKTNKPLYHADESHTIESLNLFSPTCFFI
jgi:hypothetical protein